MCGFAGCVDWSKGSSDDRLRALAEDMSAAIRHRGPDDHDVWADAEHGLALGHQRLTILDLTSRGRQPMHSADGRWTLVYNGEIYNHRELRENLPEVGFNGSSDTETMVEAIAAWGVRRTLERANGMFALAVWDRRERTLTLARDRLGIKPLYVASCGHWLLFGSELSALRRHPDFPAELDPVAVGRFFEHGYVPGPLSIYRDTRKLTPGHICEWRLDSTETNSRQSSYWELAEVIDRGRESPFTGSPQEAVEELRAQVDDAVRLRMLADVPLGGFLSGGIDSSLVMASLQRQASGPVQAFTIGFEDPRFDESREARAVAERLGVEHILRTVTAAEARDVIPRIPAIWDEPFADSSQIPTWLVSQLARRTVKVSLSGDGGDELFGGYRRYAHIAGIWKKMAWLPWPVRRQLAALYRRLHRGQSSDREAELWPGVLAARTGMQLYAFLHRHWKQPDQLVHGAAGLDVPQELCRGDLRGQMMATDTLRYLPDDILTKVDRASMSVGLEARVPLLDHRLVEWSWRIPIDWKARHGQSKWILKQAAVRDLPEATRARPKMGFGVPLADWLRTDLREWAEELLAPSALDGCGLLRSELIRSRWQAHLDQQADWSYLIWDVLMFQAWWQYHHASR